MTQILFKQNSTCAHNLLATDFDTGELICTRCGWVISERKMATRQERRQFAMGINDTNRLGPKITLSIHDKGLSTVIGAENHDAYGKILSMPTRSSIRRLRLWDSRIHLDGTSRGLINALNLLHMLKDKLGLSDSLVEKSAYIYRKAKAQDLIRGRKNDGLMAASVYAACRQHGALRTLNDVSEAAGLSKKSIGTCYRLLHQRLGFNVIAIDPVDCVCRIASNVGISEKISRFAVNVVHHAQHVEFSAGKDPMGLAAAALYIACIKFNEKHSQTQLAEAANVTSVTVRSLSKGLRQILVI